MSMIMAICWMNGVLIRSFKFMAYSKSRLRVKGLALEKGSLATIFMDK